MNEENSLVGSKKNNGLCVVCGKLPKVVEKGMCVVCCTKDAADSFLYATKFNGFEIGGTCSNVEPDHAIGEPLDFSIKFTEFKENRMLSFPYLPPVVAYPSTPIKPILPSWEETKKDIIEIFEALQNEKPSIERVCSNCEHQLGEECAIDGHEIWDDSTCDNFTGDFHSH